MKLALPLLAIVLMSCKTTGPQSTSELLLSGDDRGSKVHVTVNSLENVGLNKILSEAGVLCVATQYGGPTCQAVRLRCEKLNHEPYYQCDTERGIQHNDDTVLGAYELLKYMKTVGEMLVEQGLLDSDPMFGEKFEVTNLVSSSESDGTFEIAKPNGDLPSRGGEFYFQDDRVRNVYVALTRTPGSHDSEFYCVAAGNTAGCTLPRIGCSESGSIWYLKGVQWYSMDAITSQPVCDAMLTQNVPWTTDQSGNRFQLISNVYVGTEPGRSYIKGNIDEN